MSSWALRITERCARFIGKRARRLEAGVLRQRMREAGAAGATSIFTHMSDEELEVLYRLARECPPGANVLEVGSYLGASTSYLAAGLTSVGGRLYCCDTWQNETMGEGPRDTFAEFLANTEGLHCELVPIRKRSVELTTHDLRLPLHLAFVDGDHSYEAVKCDFDLIAPWIAPDGVIAFHDFSHSHFPGVTRLVGEALASGDWVAKGFADSLVWLRRADWRTPSTSQDGHLGRARGGEAPVNAECGNGPRRSARGAAPLSSERQ